MSAVADTDDAYRRIPSVDRLLQADALQGLIADHGRTLVRDGLRARLAELRSDVHADETSFDPNVLARALSPLLEQGSAPSLREVANLTGTVLHTNLGRAPLPEEAIEAMARVARSACNLEYDIEAGQRGERDDHVARLVTQLTGAESALVVNNNAAAVFLVLNTIAARREGIVSRGELVEIGGQFRVPDIMARAGTRLLEVGTTNRTHLRDYAEAIGPRTGLLMKVHTSNYEIRGFTASVTERELAGLALQHGLPLVSDLGSGTLVDLHRWGLPHEPTVREMVDAGVDLVTFSGDKLLGGPQCGVIAGPAALIAKLRKNPLKRALRVDKLTLAALEQVLQLYTDPERLAQRLPALRQLTRPAHQIRRVAESLGAALGPALSARYGVRVAECTSQIGSGALPLSGLPSVGVRIEPRTTRRDRNAASEALLQALRRLPLPVIGRVEDGAVMLDCRCLEDPAPVLAALARLEVPA